VTMGVKEAQRYPRERATAERRLRSLTRGRDQSLPYVISSL
jgi:hypothetical protein